MVPLIRPVWVEAGQDNQMGRPFPPLTYDPADAAGLTLLDPAPRIIDGARELLSIGLQYANAFLRGFQAATLKAADHFGDDDSLYSFEDMATGEIRLSILWEWLHKGAPFTEAEPALGVRPGDPMTAPLFSRLLEEEYGKLLRASDRDVHDDSKRTTLPIARSLTQAYVMNAVKLPWFIDLLNLNLGVTDPALAAARMNRFLAAYLADGPRITENLDFQQEAQAAGASN